MRTLILAIAATAAVALLPATAAADPVQVLDASTGQPCSSARGLEGGGLTGGCQLPFVSGNQRVWVTGSGSSYITGHSCPFRFNMNVGADGTGLLSDIAITPGHSSCGGPSLRECHWEGDEIPWYFEMQHDGSGNRAIDIFVCHEFGYPQNNKLLGKMTLDVVETSEGIRLTSNGAPAWFEDERWWSDLFTPADSGHGVIVNLTLNDNAVVINDV